MKIIWNTHHTNHSMNINNLDIYSNIILFFLQNLSIFFVISNNKSNKNYYMHDCLSFKIYNNILYLQNNILEEIEYWFTSNKKEQSIQIITIL